MAFRGAYPQGAFIESQEEKLKYPRAVPFIVGNEFCERFSYYGMRAILVLYLHRKLMFEEGPATAIYHSFVFLIYLCCLLGAVSADSFIGKFKTILWLSIIFAIGICLMAFGAIQLWKMPALPMTIVGLILIAVGSGAIKPCVAAFGAEQFQLPEQILQIARFFSIFYFAINLGSFISTIVTPIFREDFHCFEANDCFPLAFGVPAVLMILAVLIFACGRFLYKIEKDHENMMLKVWKCIGNAISTRKREKKTKPRDHWLEYAEPVHGKEFVNDVKIVMNILVLYLPLPLFWALFDQQASRWTFQATHMDGDLGFLIIKPDQMQVVNPFLILTFIPLFECIIYPLLSCIGLRRPIQKMAVGGLLAGVAFLFSMFVQFKMDAVAPQEISILWQLPQYVTMTLGEVMFSVTGLHFSFAEAPENMRTVVAACWQLTVAFGNLLVIIVVSSRVIENQATEFLFFAGLMFIDMIIFLILGYRFKSIPLDEADS